MVTFLVTSLLLLGLIAIAIYFWQKPANRTETIELPPPPQVASLFATEEPKQLAASEDIEEANTPPAFVHGTEEQQVLAQSGYEINKQLPDEEPGNKQLLDELIESWRKSPDRSSTAKLLHTAALSDDADTYRNAVELVLNVWQGGAIQDLSATELQALLNAEFWLLSSSTRSSGAGFVLKRTLSRANRELERANIPTKPSTTSS